MCNKLNKSKKAFVPSLSIAYNYKKLQWPVLNIYLCSKVFCFVHTIFVTQSRFITLVLSPFVRLPLGRISTNCTLICFSLSLSHTHTRTHTHTHTLFLSVKHTQISFALWLPIEVSVSLCFSHFNVVPPTCTTCLIVLKIQKSKFVSSYKTEDSFWTYKVFHQWNSSNT